MAIVSLLLSNGLTNLIPGARDNWEPNVSCRGPATSTSHSGVPGLHLLDRSASVESGCKAASIRTRTIPRLSCSAGLMQRLRSSLGWIRKGQGTLPFFPIVYSRGERPRQSSCDSVA